MAVVLVLTLASNYALAISYCDPAKSKPCGQGCISLDKTCRKDWTTSKAGKRPTSAKPGFANPKFVTEVPK